MFESVTSFVINPVLVFLVFYVIGLKLKVDLTVRYMGILKHAFIGSVIGFATYLSVLTAFFGLFHSPQTGWLENLATIVLDTVSTSVNITLLAFAGVLIGNLQSAKATQEVSETATSAQMPA